MGNIKTRKEIIFKWIGEGFSIVIRVLIALAILFENQAKAQDTLQQNKPRVLKIFLAPTVLISAGLITTQLPKEFFLNSYEIREERNEHLAYFHYHLDDYLQYLPIAVVSGLNLVGVKGKNDFANRTALLIKSEILMTAIVVPLKHLTHVQRPDGSNYESFPSGHTAQSFVAATFIHKEYGHKSIWYSIGGYTVATGIGVLRIMNNKHWFSDVLVGAGIGILSTNIVYHTHRYKWGKNKKKSHATILPTYGKGPGFYFALRFK